MKSITIRDKRDHIILKVLESKKGITLDYAGNLDDLIIDIRDNENRKVHLR